MLEKSAGSLLRVMIQTRGTIRGVVLVSTTFPASSKKASFDQHQIESAKERIVDHLVVTIYSGPKLIRSSKEQVIRMTAGGSSF